MPSFFVLMYGGCRRRILVEGFCAARQPGIPRRYIPCRWYEFLERLGKGL